jgi:hypothetical protein
MDMNNFSVFCKTGQQLADCPSEERESIGNRALGTFLLAVRANDHTPQVEGYQALDRMAKLIAASLGYETNSKDYRDILHDFLVMELHKSQGLTSEEITQLQRANKFAYVRTALRRDYIDDLRGAARKTRLHHQYDELKEQVCTQFSESEELAESFKNSAKAKTGPVSNGLTANFFSKGEAAICKTLVSLLHDSRQCEDFVNPECSDTKCKSKFVRYVAAVRAVGEQVVRRDIKRLKDKLNFPDYSPLREMLLRWRLGT